VCVPVCVCVEFAFAFALAWACCVGLLSCVHFAGLKTKNKEQENCACSGVPVFQSAVGMFCAGHSAAFRGSVGELGHSGW
jgi:hypothetical protein